MQVAVAQAGIGRAQQHLVRLGFRDFQRFNRHRLVGLMEHGCAHCFSSPIVSGRTLGWGLRVVNRMATARPGIAPETHQQRRSPRMPIE